MPQGTVKWFNNAKGYGFVVEDGKTEDLFAHFSSIQMEGYKTLKAGQAVEFEKQPADKGFHAINIRSAEKISDHSVDHDDFISVEEPDISHQKHNTATKSTTSETKLKESV